MNAHPNVNDAMLMISTHLIGLAPCRVPLVIKCIAAGTQRTPSVRRTVPRTATESPDAYWQRVVNTVRELKAGYPWDHCVTLVCDYRNPYSAADWFMFDANHNMRQILWHVTTRDVDGSTRKAFKSHSGARKRFEEMCGHTLEQALAEIDPNAKLDAVHSVRGVSNFGTVVVYTRKAKGEAETDLAQAEAELDLAQNPDAPEHQADAPADAVVTPEPVALAPAPVADAKAERAAAAAAKREAKETEKARKLAAQQEAKEARDAVARVKAEAKVKPTHYLGRLAEQNGVKAPQREGSIATAWALFDSATDTIYSAHLPQLAELHGANLGNLQIELNRWRRFNGIAAPGRMPKAEAAAE